VAQETSLSGGVGEELGLWYQERVESLISLLHFVLGSG
jgi:hypothetical protein